MPIGRRLLSVVAVLSLVTLCLPTEFTLCSYDENYKTTAEERKFYGMITRKVLMKCGNVIARQIMDIPGNPRKIFESAVPKACFMYRVCMTLTKRENATGRSRYQMSIEDTEKVVDCVVRFTKLIDPSLLSAMFNLTDLEAMQFNPADLLIGIMGCYLRHVGAAPGQIDPALKIGVQIYGKIVRLLD